MRLERCGRRRRRLADIDDDDDDDDDDIINDIFNDNDKEDECFAGIFLMQRPVVNGGRFDFDDGGTYCGGWEEGKAHGHGVCTGPKGQGEYSGSWHYGFEVSGVYTWPSGSTFEGHWQNGKRHGLGVEARGRWVYRGEWTQGYKGRYGVRQSTTSGAKYEGTWANGLQDGYGSETYADGGTFQGQWLRGTRHGYGVRTSAPFGLASHYRNKNLRASLTSLRSDVGVNPASERDRKMDDCRGGFVLKAKSDEQPARRRSLAEKNPNIKNIFRVWKKMQRSSDNMEKRGSGSIKSTGSSTSWASTESSQSGVTNASAHTDSNVSFVSQDDVLDANVTETYMGEWKNDKRCGFGISERSDGLKFEGEWYNNKKYGYGVTTFKDGAKEEGKYKNNVLITSNKKKHIFLIRSAKFRERIDSAVNAAIRASQIALQKADIAISRTATARGKGEQADIAAIHAREDSDFARLCAKQFAPDFHQPGLEVLKKTLEEHGHGDLSLMSTPKAKDDQTAFRSKSFYYRSREGDSKMVDLGDGDERSSSTSTGGFRMSIDRGASGPDSLNNPQYKPLLMNHPNTTNNPMHRLQGGDHDHGNGHDTSQDNNVHTSAHAFSMHGSIRRGKNLSIRDDPRGGGGGGGIGGGHSIQQAMNDHFDQYKMTSQNSVDRVGGDRGSGTSTPLGGGIGGGSRTSSLVSRAKQENAFQIPRRSHNPYGTDRTPDSGVSDSMDTDESPTRPSLRRSTLPVVYPPELLADDSSEASFSLSGLGVDVGVDESAMSGARRRAANVAVAVGMSPSMSHVGVPTPPPSTASSGISSPQRTASLYIASPVKKTAVANAVPIAVIRGGPPRRKKSLPDIQLLPKQLKGMSREEVSALSSQRREEVRRQMEEAERLRANPLLYVFNPNVKDWLSKQQLVMLVLVINISLAIMFFKLLT